MTNEHAKKSKKHTRMPISNAQFWSLAICTSWTSIKCCKSDTQIQHANDKSNVRLRFFCLSLFFHSESIGDSLISFIQLFLMQFFSLTGDLANVPKKGVAGLRLW